MFLRQPGRERLELDPRIGEDHLADAAFDGLDR